jgi:hypothetical protein
MAVRRWSRALRAALACGVGALFRLPPEADVPRRIELTSSRVAFRSRGVWTDFRDEGGSALMARRPGVLVLRVAPSLGGVVSMAERL